MIVISTKTSEGRSNGTSRIWLEGQKLRRGQFSEGQNYEADFKKGVLKLYVKDGGKYKVSKRKLGPGTKPIIDICNKKVSEWFPAGTKLIAHIRKGFILIRQATQAIRTHTREARVLQKLAKGEPLNVVSLFHGAGVMDRAIHDGFSRDGIKLQTTAVVELESNYLDASLNANPMLFNENTVFFNGPIQEFELGKTRTADLAVIGMPCVGASKSGRAKCSLAYAESHSEAGALFFSAMDWLRKFQPAMAYIECVPQYRSTASMEVIRSLLSSWGYHVFETTLNGCEYGALENRDRMVAIAISKGLCDLAEFDLGQIEPIYPKPAILAEALDDYADDDPAWQIFHYLERKEASDNATPGKSFKRQLYTGDESHINTITRGYARRRSTDPHLTHPDKPRYTRLLNPVEHARVKGLPNGWIQATQLATTEAHEVLGQSVIFPVFAAVGLASAKFLNRAAANDAVYEEYPQQLSMLAA